MSFDMSAAQAKAFYEASGIKPLHLDYLILFVGACLATVWLFVYLYYVWGEFTTHKLSFTEVFMQFFWSIAIYTLAAILLYHT